MDALDRVMKMRGVSAYAMIGSSDYADMRYLTRFVTSDPIVYIRRTGERGYIVVSQMEYSRAQQEAATGVMTRADAGLLLILESEKDRWLALARMIADHAGGEILVPPDLPFALGYHLDELEGVVTDTGTIASMRAKKSHTEVSAIGRVQRSAEMAMAHAIDCIRRSKSRNGVLWLGGKPLTSERVRSEMHTLLMNRGCLVKDTIVSCGKDTAAPHNRGTGPLMAGEPVVIDIFPNDERTGYYSDMTRTVVKGDPSPEIREMYDAVSTVQDYAASMIKPGITGEEVYQAVVDLFSSLGYRTGREGFTHNLGHGVGLEVHELPSIGPGGAPLIRGNVVTNEPGLYYENTGGVRLENIGVLTRTGYRCITSFPKELVV
ncbi:MAG: Xaa-Pro peptidase family protein [Methanoregulaceae archaeon]|nr:Xaa-Pro peptidase family protein [Methanoregulaceae archaeon]